MSKPIVIAIDGPAASGKGTLARRLADHFGFAHLDSGALYRAVALSVLEAGNGLWRSIAVALTLAPKARRERRILSAFCAEQLAKEAQRSDLIARHSKRLHWAVDRYLHLHMARLRLLARVQAYERLFALWHVVHLPFFVLLVLSVALHIFAVHRY